MFLPSWYFQRMLDNFAWFSVYIVATVLMGFFCDRFFFAGVASIFFFLFFSLLFPFLRVLGPTKKEKKNYVYIYIYISERQLEVERNRQ